MHLTGYIQSPRNTHCITGRQRLTRHMHLNGSFQSPWNICCISGRRWPHSIRGNNASSRPPDRWWTLKVNDASTCMYGINNCLMEWLDDWMMEWLDGGIIASWNDCMTESLQDDMTAWLFRDFISRNVDFDWYYESVTDGRTDWRTSY